MQTNSSGCESFSYTRTSIHSKRKKLAGTKSKKNSKSFRQTNENQLILGSNFLSERFAVRSKFKLVFRKKKWTKTKKSED